MQVVAKTNFDGRLILQKHGLDEGGRVQKFIDNECIRLMDPYTPHRSVGSLELSVRANTVLGSGKLVTATPYARYLYYGLLMVDPVTGKGCFFDPKTGRKWSRPNTPKVLTNTPLNYTDTPHPMAGAHWFERMKADHVDDIARGACIMAGGYYRK